LLEAFFFDFTPHLGVEDIHLECRLLSLFNGPAITSTIRAGREISCAPPTSWDKISSCYYQFCSLYRSCLNSRHPGIVWTLASETAAGQTQPFDGPDGVTTVLKVSTADDHCGAVREAPEPKALIILNGSARSISKESV
jgi:hypothetical protein